MSSISVSPRTGKSSLSLPAEDVFQFLPARVKAAIAEAAKAAKKVSEVSLVLYDEGRLIGEARRKDTAERADAVAAGKPDPGPVHAEKAQQQIAEATRVQPVLEELHRRTVVNIQRIAQSLPEKELVDLAVGVVRRHRRLIELTETAETAYGDEARIRACLEWLIALRADEPVGKRGSVQLLDVARYFDIVRTSLTTSDGIEQAYYGWDSRVRKPQQAGATSEVGVADEDGPAG